MKVSKRRIRFYMKKKWSHGGKVKQYFWICILVKIIPAKILILDSHFYNIFLTVEIGRGNGEIFRRTRSLKDILFEYFRSDNQMSVDSRDRYRDGFPFLLEPLSQLRGISSPVKSNKEGAVLAGFLSRHKLMTVTIQRGGVDAVSSLFVH